MINKGLHQNRLKDNPLEKKFAEAWEKRNRDFTLLEYLLSVDNRPGYVKDRDRIIAATVIQWLGTPVGQNFLCGVLGLEKIETN